MKQNTTLHLSKLDFDSVVIILKDLERVTKYGFVIGGSLAQRALLPNFALSLKGEPMHDLDIVILGWEKDTCPIRESIKDSFYVLYINKTQGGYYFGLIHKATKKWVDLFAPEYEQNFTKISIDYKMYKATTLESQILYLAHDLLSRINRNKSVREKWIKKLELLSNEQVNWNVIQSEYENNSNYFHTVIPAKDILHYVEAKKYVEYSIFTAKDHITSNTLERLKAIFKYPDGSVATPNGIVVEKKSTALKLYLF